MGVVYRARDLSLNRNAAIKFLSSAVADEDRRRRFLQEAQTASSLNHPHLLTVYEVGAVDGQQYLVSEFIDGWTLREWARRKRPSPLELVDLLAGVADGLACAHQAGIIHRDLKPENILVSKDGWAKLVDFGLAKVLEPLEAADQQAPTISGGPTRAGTILGTIAYMSPEQAVGKPVDARSDIFSFGVVLYELLAGERPFGGASDLDLLHAVVHAEPRPLAQTAPDAPIELRLLVEKALEKDPANRYQSMRELVVDLRRVQRSKPAPAPPGRTHLPARTSRRGWKLAGALSAAILLAAVIVLWRLWQADFFWSNPLANAQFTRLTDFEGREADAAMSPDGKFVAFLSDRDGSANVWITRAGSGQFSNLTKGAFPDLFLFATIRTTGFSWDGANVWASKAAQPGRLEELATSLMPAMGGAARLFLEPGTNPAWSPDGTRLVYFQTAAVGDPMFLADANGGNPKKLFQEGPGGHCHHLTWSPDGRYTYFTRGSPTANEMDVWRILVAGGEPERITRHQSRVGYPTLLDNRTVVYSATAEDGSGSWLYGMDVERRIPHRLSSGLEQYGSVSASADGKRLVASQVTTTGSLWRLPLSDREVEESAASRYPLPGSRARTPKFGPDYLLYLSSTGGAEGLWKVKDGVATELWKPSEGGVVAAPAVSPDGRQVCFPVRSRDRARLMCTSSEGINPRPLAASLLHVRRAPAWSPEGKWLAVSGDDGSGSGLFKAPADGGPPVRLVKGLCFSPVWSPDGRFIVYSGPLLSGYVRLQAVTTDGKPYPVPDLRVHYDVEQPYRFLPRAGNTLAVILGQPPRPEFWLVEIETDRRRRVAGFREGLSTKAFDISPDGKQIVFDRIRETSDLVLIERKR